MTEVHTYLTQIADTMVKVEYEEIPVFHINSIVTTHEGQPRIINRTPELIEKLHRKIKQSKRLEKHEATSI